MRFLIWSIRRQEWWLPEGKGYTPNRAKAGSYAYEEILNQAVMDRTKDDVPGEQALIPIPGGLDFQEDPDAPVGRGDYRLAVEVIYAMLTEPTIVSPAKIPQTVIKLLEVAMGKVDKFGRPVA